MTNSADSDQLASSNDLNLHCLLRQGMLCSAREGLRFYIKVNNSGPAEPGYALPLQTVSIQICWLQNPTDMNLTVCH